MRMLSRKYPGGGTSRWQHPFGSILRVEGECSFVSLEDKRSTHRSVDVFLYSNCLMHFLKSAFLFSHSLCSLWDSGFVKTQAPWGWSRNPATRDVGSTFDSNPTEALETLAQWVLYSCFFVKNIFTLAGEVESIFPLSTKHFIPGLPVPIPVKGYLYSRCLFKDASTPQLYLSLISLLFLTLL